MGSVVSRVVRLAAEDASWMHSRAVEPELADAANEGVVAEEEGRSWVAAHVLVPQVERAARLVALAVGVAPSAMLRYGGLRWETLGETLDRPEVGDALGRRLAPGIARLFNDIHGRNIRNEIAHGASDPRSDHDDAALIALLAIISIAVLLGCCGANRALLARSRRPARGE